MDNAAILVFVNVSKFLPLLDLGVLVDASLTFHSAKTTNRKGVSSEDFFALSAYSFKTAVADQKDAYTILCLSGGSVNNQSAVAATDKTKKSGDSNERHGKKYVLWELSGG